jgi:hypothetical protein
MKIIFTCPNPVVKIKRILIVFFILTCFSKSLYAQVMPVYEDKIVDTSKKKLVPLDRPGVHHFHRATAQLMLVEVLPWVFSKYITHQEYSNISWSTTWRNIKPNSWEWDQDPFQTNQFGHPYHGSLFFNAFRSNGYSFWQSVPATFAGSYLWETFGEKEKPAVNDFINTGFGGVVLGEMTHRFANMIVNNRGRGFKRHASEVVAFVVNPQNGLNRILSGQWGKRTRNTRERDSSQVSIEFDLGARRFTADNESTVGWYGRAKLLYGTPYQEYRVPFSNILINVEFGRDDSSMVNAINVYGSLAGWRIRSNKDINHLVVLSANYDYIRNQAFFFGGQSVKANLLSEFSLPEKVKINTNLGTGPILLGAVPDPYLKGERTYDYGMGVSVNGGAKISYSDRVSYGVNYRGGWLRTVSGNKSHYFIHTVSNEVTVKLVDALSVSAEGGYFRLEGNYGKAHPDLTKNYPYARLSARYSLDLSNK